MRRYNGIYLLSDKLNNETLEQAIQKVETGIEDHGGQVERKLLEDGSPARALKRQSAGTYVEITFELEPDKVSTLYASHKLDTNVLRAMVVLARKPNAVAKDETPAEKTTEGVKDGISQ